MNQAIRSMAILTPHPGKEQELIAFLRQFYTMMHDKKYSRDMLFHDQKKTDVLIHVRLWRSPEAREAAVHDPDVHRYWMKLPELGTVTTIYEDMEAIFSTEHSVPVVDYPGTDSESQD
jgi:hypothetical protein